jgi:hypothetical protein
MEIMWDLGTAMILLCQCGAYNENLWAIMHNVIGKLLRGKKMRGKH